MARPRFHALLTIPVAWHLRHRWGYPGALALAMMGIFIDGDHVAEVVYAEVQDAQLFLAPGGVIVLHDCNPHTEAMQIVCPKDGIVAALGHGERTITLNNVEHEATAVQSVDS